MAFRFLVASISRPQKPQVAGTVGQVPLTRPNFGRILLPRDLPILSARVFKASSASTSVRATGMFQATWIPSVEQLSLRILFFSRRHLRETQRDFLLVLWDRSWWVTQIVINDN